MNKLRILSLERMGTDTNTTVIVPGIAGDSHPGRGMRLRVHFDDRELLGKLCTGRCARAI